GLQRFLIGITAGPDGNLWFTESGADRIGRITPTGTITEFGIPPLHLASPAASPQDIVLGPDGEMWFTDSYLNRIGHVNVVSGQITVFPTPSGTYECGPSCSGGITVGPDGNLWFTEPHDNRIRVADSGQRRLLLSGHLTWSISGLGICRRRGFCGRRHGRFALAKPTERRPRTLVHISSASTRCQPSVSWRTSRVGRCRGWRSHWDWSCR